MIAAPFRLHWKDVVHTPTIDTDIELIGLDLTNR